MGLFSGWTYGARRTKRWGPFRFNFAVGGRKGWLPRFTSWGLKWWRFGHNVTRNTSSIDTPGPGGIRRKWGRR